MIRVTRLDHSSIVLNSDLIEQIDSTPDTVISLAGGERIMVRETTEELIARVIAFRRSILHPFSREHFGAEEAPVRPGGNANGG